MARNAFAEIEKTAILSIDVIKKSDCNGIQEHVPIIMDGSNEEIYMSTFAKNLQRLVYQNENPKAELAIFIVIIEDFYEKYLFHEIILSNIKKTR